MKKLFIFLIFIGSLTVFSEKISAQSVSKEPVAASLKPEEAVMVAYPNPARDFIVVKSKDASLRIKSVTFYSILGMEVADYTLNKNSAEIRLDRLRPGKYLMRYTMSDNTQKVTQIVKQ